MERNSRRSLVALTIVTLAILGNALAETNSTDTSSTPSQEIKNVTAGGHSYGNDDSYGGYGGPSYGHNEYYGYESTHHLVDDYVCDFDASILVVTNSNKKYKKDEKKGYGKDSYGSEKPYGAQDGYGSNGGYGSSGPSYGNDGYGNNGYGDLGNHAIAHRLRCSAVAIRNDDDCKTCCQLAARRDRSIAKERVIGFIVDNDQVYRKDKDSYRQKRQAVGPPASSPVSGGSAGGSAHSWAPTSAPAYQTKPQAKTYRTGNNRPETPVFPPQNPRCVCCAPKHHYNTASYGYGQAGDYNSNSYGSNQQYGGYQPPYGPPPAHGPYGSGPAPGGYNAPPPPPSYNSNPYGPAPPPKYPSKGVYGQ